MNSKQRTTFAVVAALAASLPAAAAPSHNVLWRGEVDDTTIVSIHNRDVHTDTVCGKAARNVDSRVFGRLPDRPVRVFLEQTRGRGQVRIVQQPSPDNGFTTKVRIHDPQGGSDRYVFVLGWEGRGGWDRSGMR